MFPIELEDSVKLGNFSESIYWIKTVKYFGKKLSAKRSLHLPSVDFNEFVNTLFILVL